ncbi:hypothetical protein [Luteolibacter sp. LG18]|uniref:hypothetical protein n=1 Tax=Luteolibacter sp. LG18 TaxID=2819286 RepID=UPI002B2CD443|nr:hypothetical protein llg_27310 [Luteolibacter sp. LG18]
MKLTRKVKTWPDCLSPAVSHMPLIFSERVIEAIISQDLTGLTCTPVDFSYAPMTGDLVLPPQPYYRVNVEGAAPLLTYRVFEKVDEQYVFRFETQDKQNDKRCKVFFRKDGFIPHIQRVRMNRDIPGDDFMRVPGADNGVLVFGEFFCSRRFVELAKARDFSNFSFTPLDSLDSMTSDFRKYTWPPETWYPTAQRAMEEG